MRLKKLTQNTKQVQDGYDLWGSHSIAIIQMQTTARKREREMKEWKKGKISDDCVCGSRFSTQKKMRQEKEKCIRNENEMQDERKGAEAEKKISKSSCPYRLV